jgi:hypothetical protein
VDVADPVGAQPLVACAWARCGDRPVLILAPGGRLGPGAGSGAGGGLGVAVAPQIIVEAVKDPGVDGVQALAAQGGLDLLGDQAAVVLHRVRGDGLVAGDAPLDPQVTQLAKGPDPGAGVLPVGDLGAQPGLDLLGLAAAAVDLAGELPLPAGQRVKASIDDDLPALGAPGWPPLHSSGPSVIR